MNVSLELDGERLAKEVANRANALEVLRQRQNPFAAWQYVVLLVVGGLWGYFTSQARSVGAELVGAAAGAGIFLAAAGFRECLSLRRRLNAVLVLVLAHEKP